ncbi:hypothetical protein HMPREF0308_1536 [Corynebacterium striatum ATCC 6940]|nr:hypothetical protein HMPREF0308_1536 [Corynebacterium striatum ATCC 6940]
MKFANDKIHAFFARFALDDAPFFATLHKPHAAFRGAYPPPKGVLPLFWNACLRI